MCDGNPVECSGNTLKAAQQQPPTFSKHEVVCFEHRNRKKIQIFGCKGSKEGEEERSGGITEEKEEKHFEVLTR